MIKTIDSLALKPYNFETRFFLQLLKSIKKDVQSKQLTNVMPALSEEDKQRIFNLYFSMRDEQMADNLLWYVKQYPNRKIIVWAHNVHVMTDYPGDLNKQMWNEKADAPPASKANWENIYMGYIIKDRGQIGRTEVIVITTSKGKRIVTAVGDKRGDDAAEGYAPVP